MDPKEVVKPLVAEVKGFWPTCRGKIDAAMVKLGTVKTAILLVAIWAVYFLIGRWAIGASAKAVAAITGALLKLVPILVLSIPYLVLAVLITVTVLFVIDIVKKKV